MMQSTRIRSFPTSIDTSMPVRRRQMRPYQFPPRRLPPHVDLRRSMTPVEDQENMQSCAANAYAGVCEYILKRRTGRNIDVSRLFIYYNGRMIEERSFSVKDDGASKKDIALGLRKFGVCLEHVWPYHPDYLNERPPPNVYAAASEITVVPLKIPRNLPAMKTCLANKIPFLIGIRLMDAASVEAKKNNGFVSMPNPHDPKVIKTGSHAVVIVGYDDRTQHFIVRNSWGSDWGLHGYFYIPYRYLLEKNLVNADDGVWAITDIVMRTPHLPTVRQMMLPGHNRDERHRHKQHHFQSKNLYKYWQ